MASQPTTLRRHGLRLAWHALLFCLVSLLLLVACNGVDREASLPFDPPLLKNRDTDDVIEHIYGPYELPFEVTGLAPKGGFVGYSFFAGPEESIEIALQAVDSKSAQLAFALYGPRSSSGVWGESLLERESSDGSAVARSKVTESGRYLILLGALERSDQVFSLAVSCADNCSGTLPSTCPVIECAKACPLGFVLDSQGCETCTCLAQCVTEFDCPDGMICGSDYVCVDECQCNQPLNEVCGANGVTYANPCEASCAGVPVVADRACATQCGELPCDLSCSNGNATGPDGCPLCECASNCASCSAEWRPVCSMNGRTFANDCVARCQGEIIAYVGSCRGECAPIHCSLDCPAGFAADPTGCPTCQCAEPSLCVDQGRFCGSDGVTYTSACAADALAVSVVFEGSCPSSQCSSSADCPLGTGCVTPQMGANCLPNAGCLGLCVRDQTCDPVTPGSCPVGYGCINGKCRAPCSCSEIFDPVCGVDGLTYDNACVATCANTPIAKGGLCCEAIDCALDCPMGFALDKNECPSCLCLAQAACDCSNVESPVCAFSPDGNVLTYQNRCWAECDGFLDILDGPC